MPNDNYPDVLPAFQPRKELLFPLPTLRAAASIPGKDYRDLVGHGGCLSDAKLLDGSLLVWLVRKAL